MPRPQNIKIVQPGLEEIEAKAAIEPPPLDHDEVRDMRIQAQPES